MNPTVPQSVIDAAIQRDPPHAQAEYLAEFRSDVESYIAREAVEACISVGIRERPPLPNAQQCAFIDPSGGSSNSMTLATAHAVEGRAVLDAIREIKPPFSPEAAVVEFARLLRSYGVSTVIGDHYAGEWPREQFRNQGIAYEPAAKPKSALYLDLLPTIRTPRTITESGIGVVRRSDSGRGDSGLRRSGVGRSHDRRGGDSRSQAHLARDARNLVHPGKAARSGTSFSKATALTALAAVYRVISDFK